MEVLIPLAIIAFLVFTIRMLLDCLQYHPVEDRTNWVLVIIFVAILGPLLYFFIVRKKRISGGQALARGEVFGVFIGKKTTHDLHIRGAVKVIIS